MNRSPTEVAGLAADRRSPWPLQAGAVLSAAAVTAAILALLALLNRGAVEPPGPDPLARVTVAWRPAREEPPPEQPAEMPEPPADAPVAETPSVPLPVAAPPMPSPLPLSFQMTLPELAPIALPRPAADRRAGTSASSNGGGAGAATREPPAPLESLAPRQRSGLDPAYPANARRRGIEDDVRVRIHVGADGSVLEVQILEGHALFHRSVREALQRWRFDPATRDGHAIDSWVVKSFVFRLDGRAPASPPAPHDPSPEVPR